MKTWRMLAALLALALALSCGGTTGGQLIHIPFQIGGVERDASPLPDGGARPYEFVTPLGWTVELSQAVVALGPFYFNVSPPQTHTFHSGVVIMQVTSQVVLDSLNPDLINVDAGADGETGNAVAVEIELYPPDGTGDPTLTSILDCDESLPGQGECPSAGVQAYVAGVATRPLSDGGVVEVPFAGDLNIDTSLQTAAQPLNYLQRVSGAACGPVDGGCVFSSDNQTLQLRVDPAHWFDDANFNSLVPEPMVFADGGLADAGPPRNIDDPYTWTTLDAFNSKELVVGLQSRDGVYNFNLVGQ